MIETLTKTLGVNAAFLSEIKQDHVELRGLLAKARRAVHDSHRRGSARELYHLLLSIQDRLALHFSLEEAYGYCEDALAIAPRLSSRATALRGEHETLFVSFCKIVDFAEQIVYRECRPNMISELATDFDRFDAELSEHERREVELILDAFDDDVGVGD